LVAAIPGVRHAGTVVGGGGGVRFLLAAPCVH
jgi:hypothetical protein